ncbi:alkaline phosphatase [Solimonas fluminis]|uniref:Alkaline phosphatase n=1 Tax=Solimonas fluminis TaxID=2086571 RepID=A0A2S5TKR0_9GAMM|nr:choice-of-anchor I family protein [Solimonas fluminis]PPE75580.1 alkaline phosphatase [Solimonas fluminis]
MKRFALTLLASTLALGLAACEGDDGKNGSNGSNGTPGLGDVLLNLSKIGNYASGRFAEGAAEIVAFDPGSKRLFVVNAADVSIDVLDLANPAAPAKLSTIQISGGSSANSVAVSNGVVAVAIQAPVKTDNGKVEFYNAATLAKISEVTVGALPDMLTFTPDGKAVLVANEGEPNAGYTIDPVGSVSVIDVATIATPTVQTIDFSAFNSDAEKAKLVADGVRIYGPGASVAQDLEPEYIAVAPDGKTAWVTLQEANAQAVLNIGNLAAPTITRIKSFGRKDHSLIGNELDANDRDGPGNGPRIDIRNWPIKGLYQPDAIAAYAYNGKTYYVTANEGDDRNDFIPGEETKRLSANSIVLDPAIFPDAATLKTSSVLGRLTITPFGAKTNQAGELQEILVLGGRSFSIWNEDGQQVYDSGSEFERIVAQRSPLFFNASNDNNNQDDRSDNKGPEPEGVVLGKISGRSFAFIGLERIGGVMVYDISNPQNARFVQYINPRDFTAQVSSAAAGDLGPEGLAFIPAANSPNGKPLLAVGNEVSGTTAIYQIDVIELKNN